MIPRHAKETALRLARGFPILAITGPRQSGKTTLARMLFADRPYVTLEDPDQRELALTDPRGFLARFPDGAVIDEAQHGPELMSYLQGLVDHRGRMGDFVLTGSQQFGLMSRISQSLAGRVGRIEQRFNNGRPAGLYFWRDNTGHEIDLLFEMGGRLQGIEIKSGATLVRDWLKGLAKWQTLAGEQALPGWLIYGGDEAYSREGIKVFDWRSLDEAAQQN